MSRVTEIRYVGYAVPDLDAEAEFYGTSWGLRKAGERDGMIFFAAPGSDEPHVVRLRKAEERRIDVIAFAADSRGDVDALHAKVSAAGCQIIFSPKELDSVGGGYGFRFFSPDGLTFEISSDVARGPISDAADIDARPEKISHIVLHSPDNRAMVDFFVQTLGFKVSDWLGDSMAFLRCNQWHHRIGILPGPPCLNHVAYDIASVDGLMRGIGRLKREGTDIRWGPGRHTAGNNTFSYFTTPNGFGVELTSDLEEVDFAHHKAVIHEPTMEVMDRWGVGVGGPHAMPHPQPDKGLFKAAEY